MPMPEKPAPTTTTRCSWVTASSSTNDDDHAGQLLPAVLLEEVPAADDRRVGLAPCAGDPLLQDRGRRPR